MHSKRIHLLSRGNASTGCPTLARAARQTASAVREAFIAGATNRGIERLQRPDLPVCRESAFTLL